MNHEGKKPPDAGPDTRPDLLRAIYAVLLELAYILSDYRNAFVVSGGLALHLLFPPQGISSLTGTAPAEGEDQEPFGRFTRDVDLILNVLALTETVYENLPGIGALLMENYYHQEHKYWIRIVNLPGFMAPMEVKVEFLAPGRFAHSAADSAVFEHMSAIQDVEAAPLGGIDLVLLQPRTVTLSGLTPTMRPLDNVPVQVADLAMLILVKAIAFQDRLRKHERNPAGGEHLSHAAKHAYDISECLRRYPGKMKALAERIGPLWVEQHGPEQQLIDDALECLRTHFASPTDEGLRRMILEERYQYASDNEKMAAQIQTARRVQQLLGLLDEHMKAVL